MTRGELCEALAKDYAKRASAIMGFEEAYNKYIERLKKRSDEEILQQFTIANLGNPRPKRTNDLPKYSREYVIKTNDDDCEDGVCKL